MRHSESVPGSNVDRSCTNTILTIRSLSAGDAELEQLIEFQGFVGVELIGQQVRYDDRTIEKTTFFDPKSRENDPPYRRGKKEIEKIQLPPVKDRWNDN